LNARAFLCIILIFALTTVLPIVRADPQKPSVYIDPKDNTFSTSTTPVGTNFTISIKAAKWAAPGIFGYEFTLVYDNTTLQPVVAGLPPDHWLAPLDPSLIFVVDKGTINQSLSRVTFAASLLGEEPGKVGNGTIATVTFKIIRAPSVGNLSSPLELLELTLVDANTDIVPPEQFDLINGNFVYVGPAPPAVEKPKVYVDPKNNIFSTSTTSIGASFNVSIKAANWSAPGVFGYKFKLAYNNTLLEATSAVIPGGHWLTPANPSNISKFDPGTINQTEGLVSFNVTLLSPEQGKFGSGTIATVTFNITKAPTTGNFSCLLEIRDLTLIDPTSAVIPKDQYTVENGNYVLSSAAKWDLDGDGKTNIRDVAIWGAAFGSYPGHPRWNPIADMNGDGTVNMVDAVLIAIHWTGST